MAMVFFTIKTNLQNTKKYSSNITFILILNI